MGQTPFYRTLNELEHHFSNIKRTRTCSSIGDRTRTPNFWVRTNEHRTLNLIGLSLDLPNYSSNRLEHHFFQTSNQLERVHLLVVILKHPNFWLPTIEYRTSNHIRPITTSNARFCWKTRVPESDYKVEKPGTLLRSWYTF